MRLALSLLHPRRQIPTTKAAAARMAAKMASGPGALGAPFPGGPAFSPAKAVAVAATASSSSASAVPVAAAAVSISGGKVGAPAGPVGEPEGDITAVEVSAVGGVCEAEVEVGLAIAVAVRVGVFVEVAGVTGVGEGPGVDVREAVGVRDGVGLGPGVEVSVRVGVLDGVRVAVGVKVRVGVFVSVRVGVFVAEARAVLVAGEVAVAGGAVTVKVPIEVETGTPSGGGLALAALTLLRDKTEDPEGAPTSTLKMTSATGPSGITSLLNPATITRMVPAACGDQDTVFPALDAADPIVTLLTERRELSKSRSNWRDATWAPPDEASRTEIAIPVCPGLPEPLSTEKLASGACAMAID